MKKYFLYPVLLITLLPAIITPAAGREVIVVPRTPETLPRTSLEPVQPPRIGRIRTVPELDPDIEPDTPDLSPEKPLRKPALIANIVAGEYFPRTPVDAPGRKADEQYYYITGRVDGMSWARLHIYEQRGGFFEVYEEAETNLLGSDFLDGDGGFRVGPVKHDGGWFSRGRDIVLVLELDSPYAVAYSEIYGIEQPFRFEIANRRRVVPERGRYEMGTVNVDWSQRQFYPARAYRRVIERLLERGIEQKIRVEFTRDVEQPRYMERIGYVLMPYRE